MAEDKVIKYQITTEDGKVHNVSKSNIEKYGWGGYAEDYPKATVRMRDENNEDYDIPIAQVDNALARNFRPFTTQFNTVTKPAKKPQEQTQPQQEQGPFKPTPADDERMAELMGSVGGTLYGSEQSRKQLGQPFKPALDVERATFWGEKPDNIGKRYDKAVEKMTFGPDVESTRQQLENDIKNDLVESRREDSKATTYNPYTGTSAMRSQKTANLEAASAFLDSADMIQKAATAEGGWTSDLARGVRDAFRDPATLTFGMSSADQYRSVFRAINKMERGEQLTKDEQTLLDAAAYNMYVAATNNPNLSTAYTVGKGAAESLPFMVEFFVNPISGIGKKAAKELAEYTVKKYAGKAIGKYLTGGLAKTAARKAGKFALGAAANVVPASAMALTTSAPRTVGGMYERMVGEVKPEVAADMRTIVYGGHEGESNVGKALAKSYASTTIENWSEFLGDQFGDILPAVGKLFGRTKIGTKIMDTKAVRSVTDFMDKVNKTDVAKAIKDIEETVQFNGTFGEFAEEVAGGIANAIVVGDQELNTGERGVFNPDNLIDTYLTCAVIGAVPAGLRITGYAASKLSNNKLKAADAAAGKAMGSSWPQMREQILNASNEARADYLKQVVTSPVFSAEDKKSVLTYVGEVAKREASEEFKQMQKDDPAYSAYENRKDIINNYNEASAAIGEEQKSEFDNYANYDEWYLQNKDASEEKSDDAYLYFNARQDMYDYVDEMNARIKSRVDARMQEVDNLTNPDTGEVITVASNYYQRPVNIVGGRLAFDEAGNVDAKASDKIIYYVDNNGKRMMATPDKFTSLVSRASAADMRQQVQQEEEAGAWAEEEVEMSQPEIKVGSTVVTPDGKQGVVTEMNSDYVSVNVDGQSLEYAPSEVSVPMPQQAETAPQPVAGQPEVKQIEQSQIQQQEPEVTTQQEGMADTTPQSEVQPAETSQSTTQAQPDEVQHTEPQTPTGQIPQDEKGRFLFTQVPADQTYAYLNSQPDISPEEAGMLIDQNIQEAQKKLDALQKNGPKKTGDITAYRSNRAQWKEEVKQAQSDLAYWNQVQDVAQQVSQQSVVETNEQPTSEVAQAEEQAATPVTENVETPEQIVEPEPPETQTPVEEAPGTVQEPETQAAQQPDVASNPGLVRDEMAEGETDADLIDAIAKKLGVTVRFVEQVAGGAANAQIVGNTIEIEKGNENPVKFLLGHEITHRVQDLASDAYQEFKEHTKRVMGEGFGNAVARMKRAYEAAGIPISNEQLEDEVVADFAGSLSENRGALEKFINQSNPTIWQILKDVFESIKSLFVGERERQINEAVRLLDNALKKAEVKADSEGINAGEKFSVKTINKNNVAQKIYETSGLYLKELNKDGVLGRVVGDNGVINIEAAKKEFSVDEDVLNDYIENLENMKGYATNAAKGVIDDQIKEAKNSIEYYKNLAEGKDVWRTETTRFSLRTKPAPKKTVKAYKLMKVDANGKLHFPFAMVGQEVPLGVWMDAEDASAVNAKGERKATLTFRGGGKGQAAPRPGFHAGDMPYAAHIGIGGNQQQREKIGAEDVWVEAEMAADIDYQEEATENGRNPKTGKVTASKADIRDRVPVDGYYRYKTNPNMKGQWLIGGSMKLNRVLSDQEVNDILDEMGADVQRMPRDGGNQTQEWFDNINNVNSLDGSRLSININPMQKEGYNPRELMPKVRGGWTKNKILKWLKQNPSRHGLYTAAKAITEYDNPQDLKDHMFYHGTVYGPPSLKPSITMSDRDVERYGGGGYGQKYWAISLSKDKYTTTNFAGMSRGVNVYPVLLYKNANVVVKENYTDSADLEDDIEQLWNDGVDAVVIGSLDQGEQELAVLNPKAICVIDNSTYYELSGLNRSKVKTLNDEEIEDLYQFSKMFVNAVKNKPAKPIRPYKPSRLNDDMSVKPDEQYSKEMEIYENSIKEYESSLREYENSEDAIRFNNLEREARDRIRFSIKATPEMETIIEEAKANGTYMKAPNGNPTNLTEGQWAQVRTKAFKDWFGDWENDPENASKVVDENGEPMIVDDVYLNLRDNNPIPSFFSKIERLKKKAEKIKELEKEIGYSWNDREFLDDERGMDVYEYIALSAKNTFTLIESLKEGRIPVLRVAFRYGHINEDQMSYNYRDQVFENGVSVVGRVAELNTEEDPYYNAFFGTEPYNVVLGIDFGRKGADKEMLLTPAMSLGLAKNIGRIAKSAVDNTGDFSTENPDIRFSLKDAKDLLDKAITNKSVRIHEAGTGTVYVEYDGKKARISDHEPNYGSPIYSPNTKEYYPEMYGSKTDIYNIVDDILEFMDIKPSEEYLTLRKKHDEDVAALSEISARTIAEERERIQDRKGRMSKIEALIENRGREVLDIIDAATRESEEGNPKASVRRKRYARIFDKMFMDRFGVLYPRDEIDMVLKSMPSDKLSRFSIKTSSDMFSVAESSGMQGVLGDQFTDTMIGLHSGLPKKVRDGIYEYAMSRYSDALSNIETASEAISQAISGYLGQMAEESPEASWWEKVCGSVRKNLKDMGVKLNDNDIRYMFWLSNKDRSVLKPEPQPIIPRDRYEEKPISFSEEEIAKLPAMDAVEEVRFSIRMNQTDKESLEQKIKNHKFREGWQDRMISLRDFQEAIEKMSGKKVRDSENAYDFENTVSGIVTYDYENYKQNYMSKITEAIRNLTNGGKADAAARVREYMKAKHGMERNALMRQRAIDKREKEIIKELGGKITPDNQTLFDDKMNKKRKAEARTDYAGLTGLYNRLAKPQRKPTMKTIEAYMTKLINDYEKNHDSGKVKALWNSVRNATGYVLDYLVKTNVMDKEGAEKIKGQYSNYIPLREWQEKRAGDRYTYYSEHGSDAFSNPMIRAEGRTKESGDPLPSIELMALSSFFMGQKNMMKLRLLRLVRNRPSELANVSKVWFVKDATGQWVETVPDISGAKTEEEIAGIIDQFEKDMEAKRKTKEAVQRRSKLDVGMAIVKRETEQHQVRVKELGVDYIINFNMDPSVAQAVNGLNRVNMPITGFFGWYSKAKRYLTGSMTGYNVDFIPVNAWRDLMSSTTNAFVKDGFARFGMVLIYIPKSLFQLGAYIYGKKLYPELKEFLENGGETGHVSLAKYEDLMEEIEKDISRYKRSWTPKSFFKAFGNVFSMANRLIENTMRFATFLASRKSGKSILQSVKDAKNASTNFDRKGSGQMGHVLANQAYFFFNPAIQAVGYHLHLWKRYPLRMSMVYAFWASVANLAPHLLWGGREDTYLSIPEHIRRGNICIPKGEKGYITLPISYELKPAFVMGDIFYSYSNGAYKGDEDLMVRDAILAVSEMSPRNFIGGTTSLEDAPSNIAYNFIPDILGPIADIMRNQTFSGRPIYRNEDYLKYVPEYRKVYKGTPDFMVNASKWLNEAGGGNYATKGDWDYSFLNPAVLEYVFMGYVGGAVPSYWRGFKATYNKLNEEYVATNDIPIVRRFYKDWQNQNGVPNDNITQRYFDYSEKVRKFESEWNQYLSGMKEPSLSEEDRAKLLEGFPKHVSSEDMVMIKSIIQYTDEMVDNFREVQTVSTEEQVKKMEQEIYKARKDAVTKIEEILKSKEE